MKIIEVRMFKWPRRPTGVTKARLLGEDDFGRWLGLAQGDPWWHPDGIEGGVFVESLVKLVPHDTFWAVCFQPSDPVVDVDIVLPVQWAGDVLEEVDIFRRMNRRDRGKAVIARPFDHATRRAGRGQQPVHALGLVGIGLRRTAGEEGLGIVPLLLVSVEGFQSSSPLSAARAAKSACRAA